MDRRLQFGMPKIWTRGWTTGGAKKKAKQRQTATDLLEAFGNWAVGNPDFNRQDDGSNSDCHSNPCNIVALVANPDVREAYYVIESLNRLRTYFTGLSQAFITSARAAALSED